MKKGATMARACILYFSQTGNTERVAYTIMGRLQAEGMESITLQLEDTADFPEAHEDADVLGIGFPTFFGYPPPNVIRFIGGLAGNGRSAFVFTTYGGSTAGDSLYDAAAALEKRGFRILGGLKVEAADNYPQSIRLKINEGRPNDADMALSEGFATRIAKAYKDDRHVRPEALASSNPFFIKHRDSPRKKTVDAMRKKIEGKIVFNEEKCLLCEACKRSCPTKSIASGEMYPEFSWKCIDGMRCYQCVRVCPGKALLAEPPVPDEEYEKFWKSVSDSEAEKARAYVVPE